MTDRKQVQVPVSSVVMARKEWDMSRVAKSGRYVSRNHAREGWCVVTECPTLGVTDTYGGFTSEHEAQAYLDGLTVHECDLEEHELSTDLDMALADAEAGDMGVTSYIDPLTMRDA